MNLGNVYLENDQDDTAIDAYKQAIEIDPEAALSHSNLGIAYLKIGQVNDAIAEHREAIKLQPEEPDFHLLLGLVFYENGQLGEAKAAWLESVRVKPDYALGYYNLACMDAIQSHKDQAFEWLSKAAQVGWAEALVMARDTDMDTLRGDRRYAEIIAVIAKAEEESKMRMRR